MSSAERRAGKTTLARALGRTLPAVVFCDDEWLVTLGFEIRSLADFEATAADHLLHVIEATDAQCLANVRRRNREKPPGIYWGPVADDTFHAVTAYFTPPHPDEGFRIQAHAQS